MHVNIIMSAFFLFVLYLTIQSFLYYVLKKFSSKNVQILQSPQLS